MKTTVIKEYDENGRLVKETTITESNDNGGITWTTPNTHIPAWLQKPDGPNTINVK